MKPLNEFLNEAKSTWVPMTKKLWDSVSDDEKFFSITSVIGIGKDKKGAEGEAYIKKEWDEIPTDISKQMFHLKPAKK